MIAGPGVCICNECIELCQEVLDGEKSRSTEPKQKKKQQQIPFQCQSHRISKRYWTNM